MDATIRDSQSGKENDASRREVNAERLPAWVRKRVRHFGFTDAEADEVVDDILDAWSAFAFDPEKANGAKTETVLNGLVANRCKMAMRTLARNRARDIQHGEVVAADKETQPMRREVPMGIDVRDAVAQLSPNDRYLCEALVRDVPQQEIMLHLGVSWYRLQELIDGIRSRFAALGLHEWLEK